MEAVFWDFLGKKQSLIFGEECGSATVWMLAALVLRTVFCYLRLDHFVPYGLIFAFPLLVQVISQVFPFLPNTYPLLPVRLAESIIGRIAPSSLAVIIPAHFLGSIFAIVVFRTIFPFVPSEIFEPIVYENSAIWSPMTSLLIEVAVVFLYVVTVVILPDLLEVNKLNSRLLSLPTLPLIWLARAANKSLTFNPAAIYALWYVNRDVYDSSPIGCEDESSEIFSGYPLQFEHLIGPVIAAILAGLFCNYVFPDDPSCWVRKNGGRHM